MALLKAIQASVAYLRASEAAGQTGDALTTLKTAQVSLLQSIIGNSEADVFDATSCLNFLNGDPTFDGEQKSTVLLAIHRKQSAGAVESHGSAGADGKKQMHEFLYDYLPAKI